MHLQRPEAKTRPLKRGRGKAVKIQASTDRRTFKSKVSCFRPAKDEDFVTAKTDILLKVFQAGP